MRRLTYLHPLLAASLAALALTACGGDDGGGGDADASPDSPPAGVCGVETTTISTYPATFSGTVITGGNELDVTEGACADERGWYGPYGPDQVIVLGGLTAGTTYVLDLDTAEDLGMYVTETCADGGPATGSCILLVDETTGAESGEFVAPAGGTVYVIIDTADGVTLADGNYTLGVRAAECTTNAQCSGATPICSAGFECVQCTSPFHCATTGAPVCDGATSTCVAGNAQCTGDDAAEQDDGPAAARTMTFPAANTPTTLTGSVCSLPAVEGDWYKFTATAAGQVRVGVTWNDTAADMDVLVYNSMGQAIAQGIAEGPGPEAALAMLPAAGEYFVEVYLYDPANSAPAVAYSVTLSLPECTNAFQCTAGEPICSLGECVLGPAQCTGDDLGEPTDDGPAGARPILVPVIGTPGTATGKICNTPSTEADWYSVTVGAGEGLVANLAWTAGPDLDVYIYDNMNRLLGTSFWLNPEIVTVTYLPAGTYYLAVYRAGTATVPAYDYTLSVTRTAAQTCTTATDCASSYKTQLYRGACTGGTCNFIAAGTRADGMACDSADDCMSADCSYIAFEADAQDSICTHTCTSNANCSTIANTVCSTGFSTNVCLPSCTTNVECGANVNSSMLDANEPWNYFTCTPASGACSP
ncbi:MAG TPA: PPC domain-containing protein [Kofleriaceae bacterium]|nr:PPC domain-containing protein [Kofleriaceae bacterium]